MAKIKEVVLHNRTTGVKDIHYECGGCQRAVHPSDTHCWFCKLPLYPDYSNVPRATEG